MKTSIKIVIAFPVVHLVRWLLSKIPRRVVIQISRLHNACIITRYLNLKDEAQNRLSQKSFHEAEPPRLRWQDYCGLDDLFAFHDEGCVDVTTYNKKREGWIISRLGGEYELHKDSDANVSFEARRIPRGYHFTSDDAQERWINLISKTPLPQDYALDFIYTPHTLFYEQLMIVFAMKSLARRHRIVIEYNKRVYYHRVDDWNFGSILRDVPISFPLHRPIHVRFEKVANTFVFHMEGKVVLAVRDNSYCPQADYAGLIFWNGWPDRGGVTPIDFEISDFRVLIPCR